MAHGLPSLLAYPSATAKVLANMVSAVATPAHISRLLAFLPSRLPGRRSKIASAVEEEGVSLEHFRDIQSLELPTNEASNIRATAVVAEKRLPLAAYR